MPSRLLGGSVRLVPRAISAPVLCTTDALHAVFSELVLPTSLQPARKRMHAPPRPGCRLLPAASHSFGIMARRSRSDKMPLCKIAMAAAMYSGGSEAFQGGFFARSLGKVGPVVRAGTPRMVASPPKVEQVEVAPGYNAPGSGQVKRTVDPYNPDFHEVASFGDAYPESTKEYKEIVHEETGHKMRVPFRRIHLSDPDPGCSHLDVYDTAGPLGADPRKGLPSVRGEWVKRREDSGDEVFTQMHYAKKGIITEEMAYCAAREGMDPEFVRCASTAVVFVPFFSRR